MRFGLIFMVLLFAFLGAVFGALNSQSIDFDFYFASVAMAKGGALLCALLIGWLLGGLLVFANLVVPLRRRVRRLNRQARLQADAAEGAGAVAPKPPELDA